MDLTTLQQYFCPVSSSGSMVSLLSSPRTLLMFVGFPQLLRPFESSPLAPILSRSLGQH